MSLVYLASVYSQGCDRLPPQEAVRLKGRRFAIACRAASALMDAGYRVFSPIAHSHPIELLGLEGVRGHHFWLDQDFAILDCCDRLFVLDLPDWRASVGISAERERAMAMGIEIRLVSWYEASSSVRVGDNISTLPVEKLITWWTAQATSRP